MPRLAKSSRSQRGVAVVTALLLTTLALSIVASLFWQQQVQVRSIENQRFQLQKRWVLLGAIDWARLILREDAKNSTVDYVGEPWSVGLQETRLSDYLEHDEGTEGSDASLSGHIEDAQSRFNLNNLALNGVVAPIQGAMLQRLFRTLHLNPDLVGNIANAVASTQYKKGGTKSEGGGETKKPEKDTAPTGDAEVQLLRFNQVDDLLAIDGVDAKTVEKLRKFVTFLPRTTPINVNTASAEVLTALSDSVTLSDATAMVARRTQLQYFKAQEDFRQNFNLSGVDDSVWDIKTNYFVVNGVVKLNRSEMTMQALIERAGLLTKIVWLKEN